MKNGNVDIYKIIHKAIRYLMFDVSMALSKHSVKDQENLRHLRSAFDDLDTMLKEHGYHEDTFFHDALKDKFFDTYQVSLKQHEEIDALWASLASRASSVFSSHDEAIWHQFYLELNFFIARYLMHIHFEETTMLPLLWQVCDQEDLLKRLSAMVETFSEETHVRSKRYIVRACNAAELKEMNYQ